MNLRSFLILSASAVIAAWAPAAKDTKLGVGDEDPVAAAEAALEALAVDGFAGSVLVACENDIVLHGDYGLAPHDPAVVRYWVASVSKGLTAVALMKLAEDGLLNVTDNVSQYFPAAPADKRDITLFQLLTHQSGLPQNYASEGVAARDEAAASILAQPLNHPPGAQFSYSNDNYSLLAIIIELSSGEPYKKFIETTISEPLDIEPVAFWPDDQRSGEYTPPLLSPPVDTGADIDWGFLGGHGARLSVKEMHRIGLGAKQGTLIGSEGRDLLFGPHVNSSSGLGVGMGWFNEVAGDGRRMLWMRGSDTSGGNALFYLVGENGLAIAAATNAGPGEDDGPGWSRDVRDAMISIFAPSGEEDYCTKM